MLFAGLDVHSKTTHITLVNEVGKVVKRGNVETSPEGLLKILGGHNEPIKAVLEASFSWGPTYDFLCEVAEEVLLAHPLKVRAIADARIKTDKIDSETLAHLLRSDLIPRAHAPCGEVRAFKRVLRQRMFFVRVQTMLKNRVHSLLAQHHINQPKLSDIFGNKGLAWLNGLTLPEPDGTLLKEELNLIRTVRERIKASNDLIKKLSEGDEAVSYLKSIPGIGEFFSVLIRYEVDDIRRFRTAGKFASYTGLVPSTYASGDKIYHGRLTKQGNKWLRWAFVESVSPAVRCSPWLNRYYTRIKIRRGVKDARTATARKISELAWRIWIEGRCYEERC